MINDELVELARGFLQRFKDLELDKLEDADLRERAIIARHLSEKAALHGELSELLTTCKNTDERASIEIAIENAAREVDKAGDRLLLLASPLDGDLPN